MISTYTEFLFAATVGAAAVLLMQYFFNQNAADQAEEKAGEEEHEENEMVEVENDGDDEATASESLSEDYNESSSDAEEVFGEVAGRHGRPRRLPPYEWKFA